MDKAIKKKIDTVSVVSFDIFDTALLRPYIKPIDLFKHFEYLNKIEYFQEFRIKAEQKAREIYSNFEDITINQIYEFMPVELKYLKNKEIKFEKQVLTANKEVKEIFDYAKKNNKKIIFTSDMYLSSKNLTDILKAKGYFDFKVYVSGELKKAKFTGTLFDFICNDLEVPPQEILHIGDNYYSDYKIPLEKGINAVLVKTPLKKLFEANERAKIFCDKYPNDLGISILLGLLSICIANISVKKEKSYWKYFGLTYGGPICYTYVKWLDFQAKAFNIDALLFVARDGYLLQKIYNLIKTKNIKNEYIYAPRVLNLACTFDIKRRIEANEYEALNSIKYLCDIFQEEYTQEDISNITTVNDWIKFTQKNGLKIQEIKAANTKKYKEYLESLNISGKKIGVVDALTTFFAAQKLLEHTLKRKVFGFYWATNLDFFQDAFAFYNFKSFDSSRRIRILDLLVLEFIMTSPEPPIKELKNGKPIYRKITQVENNRIKIFPELENGIMDFTKIANEIFGDNNLFMSSSTIVEWINLFCTIPTEFEKEQFSSLGLAIDASHKEYQKFPRQWFLQTGDLL